MTICIPNEVSFIIDRLEKNGYEAYAVGGCVRDAVLGKAPEDWDICTSALPEHTKQCFEGRQIIETGSKHGTITLLIDLKPFEVTTYRTDGIYSDRRHPDKVEFVNELKADLSRRDFTINAMAYSPHRGFVDSFNGISDIKNKTIRTVGDADKRFQEDALRIMRALRFASVLGFNIEDETSAAIIRNRALLNSIAAERISAEINKLAAGSSAGDVLLSYALVMEEIIPEARGMNKLWEHTAKIMSNAPAEIDLRLAALLYDITGHLCSQPEACSDMAKEILLRLKYDNAAIEAVTQLILYHDADIRPERSQIKRWLNLIGVERFRRLILFKMADEMAQPENHRQGKISALGGILPVLDDIIEQRQCFSLKELAVNGRDLIAIGAPEGAGIGEILNRLLELVIDELTENDKEQLLKIANEMAAQTR